MMTENGLSAADVYAVTRNSGDGCNNGNGMWGSDWLGYLLLFALLGGGYGGFGGFGGGGILPWLLFGNGGFGGGCGSNCATQADLAAGFNNSAVLNSLNDIKLGQAQAINYNNQGFSGLNTSLLQGFAGVDNAICTLGYQQAQCCCDIKGGIKDVAYGNERNSWHISKQISDCCCDLEKMNLQNRFDAQAYNCNTLQAIDKLGDRIDNRLNAMENARVREQLDAERTKNAVLQGQIDRAQLRYDIVNDVRPCPQPAYITCNPYAYTNPCGCGNGSF